VIEAYFDMLLQDSYKVKYETVTDPDIEDKLDNLLDKNLKTVEMNSERHPDKYINKDSPSVREMVPDDYKLKMELGLEYKKDSEAWKVYDFLKSYPAQIGLVDDPRRMQ